MKLLQVFKDNSVSMKDSIIIVVGCLLNYVLINHL